MSCDEKPAPYLPAALPPTEVLVPTYRPLPKAMLTPCPYAQPTQVMNNTVWLAAEWAKAKAWGKCNADRLNAAWDAMNKPAVP